MEVTNEYLEGDINSNSGGDDNGGNPWPVVAIVALFCLTFLGCCWAGVYLLISKGH